MQILTLRRAPGAWLSTIAAALALTVLPAPGAHAAQEKAGDAQQQRKFGQTDVRAVSLDYDLGKRQVVASGNVNLVSGNSRMTADRMTVQFAPNQGLQWVRSEGKVFIEKTNPVDKTTTTARGETAYYTEADQKANLEGGVTVQVGSPRLAKPAVVTGARIDLDLKTEVNVVHRSSGEQAKVHVEPKGQDGKPAPEPVDLIGDRIEMNGRTQQYSATGKPSLVRPSSKLQARVIRFEVDGDTNDVRVAHADDNVIFDGKGEDGQIIHATGDKGVYTRSESLLTLTGDVRATVKEPNEDQPTVYTGAQFIYNTRTRVAKLRGDGTKQASAQFPSGKLEKPAGDRPGGAGPGAGGAGAAGGKRESGGKDKK